MTRLAEFSRGFVTRRGFLGGLRRFAGMMAAWFSLAGACRCCLSEQAPQSEGGLPAAEPPAPREPTGDPVGQAPDGSPTVSRARLREGTSLAQVPGVVRHTGDRYTFFGNDAQIRLVMLENLFLERIVRAQQSCAGSVVWQVWGVVTEFRGENYLLVQRATIQRVEVDPQAPH